MEPSPKTGAIVSLAKALEAFYANPFELDRVHIENLKKRPRVIVTNEPFPALVDEIPVKCIEAPFLSAL